MSTKAARNHTPPDRRGPSPTNSAADARRLAHAYTDHHHAALRAATKGDVDTAIHHTNAMRDLLKTRHDETWLELGQLLGAIHAGLLHNVIRTTAGR